MNIHTSRKRSGYMIAVAVGLWLAVVAPSHASTITANPASLQSGITYEWNVTMGGVDSASYNGTVGAKSWNEPNNPVGSKGWTHTSNWTALEITGSNPILLTVDVARTTAGGGLLTPAMTLFQGWATGPTGPNGEWHTWNNVGNPWETDPTNWDWSRNQMGYLAHEANTSGQNSISRTFWLNPGFYTLNFGGNPTNTSLTGNHGYLATLTTSPVPVPAAIWLFGSGIAGLAAFARRRKIMG